MAVYGATKSFNLFLAEALWAEYQGRGIDVLAVCPGVTTTGFQEVADVDGNPPGLMVATAAVMAATTITTILGFRLNRSVPVLPLVTLCLVLLLGGATLALGSEAFIKIRPTLGSLLFAGALALGLPAMVAVTKGKDAFLRTAGFFITPSTTESSIETMLVQRLLECSGLHHIGVLGTAMVKRVDVGSDAFLIDVFDKLHA